MFVVQGDMKFVLTDPDEVIYAKQGDCIKITPGRWHGYQSLGNKMSIIMEYATHKHDLKNPDDQRKPYDAFNKWEKENK